MVEIDFLRIHSTVSASIASRGWHLVASERLKRPERYHLTRDPDELRPFLGPAELLFDRVALRLLRRVADAQVAVRRGLGGKVAAEATVPDSAERERLRVLGYVQ